MTVTAETRPAGAVPHGRDRGPFIALGLLAALALIVFCFAYPPLKAEPRDVPIGVVGPPAAAQQLEDGGRFKAHQYGGAQQAIEGIRNREVYGAIVLAPSGPTLYTASAASPVVAQMLQGAAQQLNITQVNDVVTNPREDPRGVGLTAALLPIVLLGLVSGLLIGLMSNGRIRGLVWVTLFSALGGLTVAAILGSGLGALAGSLWTNSAALGLVLLALSVPTYALTRLIGPASMAIMAPLMILLGNPGSGAQSAPEMLVQPWRATGPFMPPGAGTSLTRGTAFFDGAATAGPMIILAAWVLAGLILLAIPKRRTQS